MTSPISAILFDLDNTLFDRETAFLRVAEDFHAEFLAPASSLSRDEAVGLVVAWDEDGYSNRDAMLARWLEEWPGLGLDAESLSAWYRGAMDRRSLPDASVNGFLADLNRAGLPWGIVTNGNGRNQRSKCRLAGLEALTSFIIASEEQGYAKPDPRIYADALAALGLASPEGVLFVGDNPVTDIDGAARFGMRTAWVARGRAFPAELHAPDLVIERVTELRGVLGV